MSASNSPNGRRGPRSMRRNRPERRSRPHLRELCDEVLASYRLAIGADLVTPEDRNVAKQVLRTLTPRAVG